MTGPGQTFSSDEPTVMNIELDETIVPLSKTVSPDISPTVELEKVPTGKSSPNFLDSAARSTYAYANIEKWLSLGV